MATRSFIGKLNKDDSITGIFCYWDGYPEHAGRILIDNYLTEQQVDQLLALGDLSSIAPTLVECESYSSRGEKGVEAKSYKDLQAFYEAGKSVEDICRQLSINHNTFYNWKKKYSGMDAELLRQFKELERENAELKRMYADLALENAAIKDVLTKKF